MISIPLHLALVMVSFVSLPYQNHPNAPYALRKIDKEGEDKNKNGKADKREGKDVSHKKALSKGGKNSHGTKIESKSKNRSFKRDSKGRLVSETSKREKKKK